MPVHLSIRPSPMCTFDLLPTKNESTPFQAIRGWVGGDSLTAELLFNSEIAPRDIRFERYGVRRWDPVSFSFHVSLGKRYSIAWMVFLRKFIALLGKFDRDLKSPCDRERSNGARLFCLEEKERKKECF